MGENHSPKRNYSRKVFEFVGGGDDEMRTRKSMTAGIKSTVPARPSTEEIKAFAQKKLKRELEWEALRRLEDAARSDEDFHDVIAWWDRLDANRERRERYHEISRSGDQLPLTFGAAEDGFMFPARLNQMLDRQVRAGELLDVVYFCPYEIHQLVTEEYLSRILLVLPDTHKELLFLCALLQYSAIRIARMRGQTDRNIRKVRSGMLGEIHRQMIVFLESGQRSAGEITAQEKELLKNRP